MTLTNEYRAYLEKAVYSQPKPSGYLRISGPDRVDFLHRQSSNDIHLLSIEHAVLTVLTTAAARILDVFYLIQDIDSIGAISLTGNGQGMHRYLKSHIFFMDKVAVSDASQELAQFILAGQDAGKFLLSLGVERTPAIDEVIQTELEGCPITLFGQHRRAGLDYRMLAHSGYEQQLRATLDQAGFTPLSPECDNLIRVENGLPGNNELSGDYTPYEVNLEAAVSTTKGCYTGQEVLARQVSYDKITRRLVGLTQESAVKPGMQVLAEGRSAGIVTSSAVSPRFGSIALAVLRRPFDETGTEVTIQESDQDVSIPAKVTSLPFRAG